MPALKHKLFSLLATLCFCLPLTLYSQSDSSRTTIVAPSKLNLEQAQQELVPNLKGLNTQEKMRWLEYMRHLGSDMDLELAFLYAQLDSDARQKALAYGSIAQTDSAKTVRTTISTSLDTIYIGNVEEGEILLDSFAITNTGTNPYLIHETKSSCDCTVLKKPEFPLMPGEVFYIRVEFDSRDKLGPVTGAVILYDNSRPNSRKIVYIRGEVVPKTNLGPVRK